MQSADPTQLINDIIEETALVVIGLATTHPPDDAFLWRLAENLDAIRIKALREARRSSRVVRGERYRKRDPHPAIERLLDRMRRGDRDA